MDIVASIAPLTVIADYGHIIEHFWEALLAAIEK